MSRAFRVTYLLKTVHDNHGEFSFEQHVQKHSFDGTSNDLNEIFTDVFYKHRFEGIVGIEILSVAESEEPIMGDHELIIEEPFWKELSQFHMV